MEIPYIEEVKRKLIHLSSLWIVAATLLLAQKQWVGCLLFAVLLVFTLVSEHDYANGGKYLGRLYGKLFSKMLRKEAKPGQWVVSGGAPVLAAALMMNVLFAPVVAAAGMAAHLAGAIAANTTLPVIGIPCKSSVLDGMDALLSTVMMPSGIPVATVAINGGANAALLAAQILAVSDAELAAKLDAKRASDAAAVLKKDAGIIERL